MTGKWGTLVLELRLSTSERGSDHVWPPGGHCYSSPTEKTSSPEGCPDSFCWGKRREKGGEGDEGSM